MSTPPSPSRGDRGRLARLRSLLDAESTLDRVVADAPTRAGPTTEPSDLPPGEALEATMAFVMGLGRALLGYGLPADRLERALGSIAGSLGLRADVFSTPTSLIVSLASDVGELTRMARVEPGGDVDLERLGALDALAGRVARGDLSTVEGTRRIARIVDRPPRFGKVPTIAAVMLVAVSAAALLGGRAAELAASGVLGGLVGAFAILTPTGSPLSRLVPVVAAATAAAATYTTMALGVSLRPTEVLIASLIVLLPGFATTTAVLELATGNLVSGTARGVSALVRFLQLGFGIALGLQLASPLEVEITASSVASVPTWVKVLAVFGAGIGFGVVLKVRPRDFGYAISAGAVAMVGAWLGNLALGPELGAFVGATVVATFAHLVARFREKPILLTLTPGVLLLVPGSVGFLSVHQMLADDIVGALETASRMLLVVAAIVAGILVASVAVPANRAL